MSRIGRMPVAIPAGVTVTIAEGNKVTVKGPKGTLERELPVELTIEEKDGHVIVSRPNDLKRMKSLHGLTRTLINNMIHGVTEGYEKVLEVNGVGYRAAKQGKKPPGTAPASRLHPHSSACRCRFRTACAALFH